MREDNEDYGSHYVFVRIVSPKPESAFPLYGKSGGMLWLSRRLLPIAFHRAEGR